MHGVTARQSSATARRPEPGQPLAAARLEPGLSHRTWSLPSADAQLRCHAFLIASGRARFDLGDNGTVEIAAPFLLWLPHEARGSFTLAAGSDGIAASIDAALVWRAVADMPVAPQLRPMLEETALARSERIAPLMPELRTSFAALVREARDPQPGASAMLTLHLGIVLLTLWRCTGGGDTAAVRGGMAGTVQRFRQLVDWHYREGLGIDDFCRRLGVTRAHLHNACLRVAGCTPLALVHRRLREEAQSRLAQTELSVEQIGYSLGFRDPAYFNRFFRRQTGQTPGAYRAAARAARPLAPPTSFAAWP